MDFTPEKLQILLDPQQGLRAVGLASLEDLNVKQLQKVAEEVNKKYRIKNYKALSKAQLITELETRIPHLRQKEGKLEDLNLKQLQALTTKYQQEYLIKNIKALNKAQLIEAIRRVAPHLEDTKEVRTATPEPIIPTQTPSGPPEPTEPEVVSTEPIEEEPEPTVISTQPEPVVREEDPDTVEIKSNWSYNEMGRKYTGNPVLFTGTGGPYIKVDMYDGKSLRPSLYSTRDEATLLPDDYFYNPKTKAVYIKTEDLEDLGQKSYRTFKIQKVDNSNIRKAYGIRNAFDPDNPIWLKTNLEEAGPSFNRPALIKDATQYFVMYGKDGFKVNSGGVITDPSGKEIGTTDDIKYVMDNGYYLNPDATSSFDITKRSETSFEAIFTDAKRHSTEKQKYEETRNSIEEKIRIRDEEKAVERERKARELRLELERDEQKRLAYEKQKKEKEQRELEEKMEAFREKIPLIEDFYDDLSWELGGGWRLVVDTDNSVAEQSIKILPKLVYNSKKYKGDIVGTFYNWITDEKLSSEFRTDFNRLKRNTGLEPKDIWAALVNAYKLAVAGEFELSKKYPYAVVELGGFIPFNLFNIPRPRKPTLQTKLGIYFPTLDVKGGGNLIIQPKPEYGGIIEALKEHKTRNVKEQKVVKYVPFILPDGREAKNRKKKEITRIPAHTLTPYDWIGELFSIKY